MRYERLTLQSGSVAFTLPLHPRLTVIAGLGRAERDGLVGELVGALCGTRRGSSMDLIDDTGRRLTVTRAGEVANDRVVDPESGADISAEFTSEDGRVDIMAGLGLTSAEVRTRARLSATDVAAAGRSDSLLSHLARVDQPTLWRAAERVQATDAFLKSEAEGIGATPEDAQTIERIEQRHEQFEAAQATLGKVRRLGVFTGGACALGGAAAYFFNQVASFGFLVTAIVTLAVGIVFGRRMAKAAKRETAALAAAGAESYIGFHIQRVNALMENQANRRRLAEAAAAHSAAIESWEALTGEAGLDWAISNRDRILAAHRRLAASDRDIDLVDGEHNSVEPAELAQTMVTRLADLRHAGRNGEGVPLILDDPLTGCETSVKQWMLELIGRSAGSPQCIYLTGDPDIAAWARMEALAGHLAVIEPAPVDEPAAAPRTRRVTA